MQNFIYFHGVLQYKLYSFFSVFQVINKNMNDQAGIRHRHKAGIWGIQGEPLDFAMGDQSTQSMASWPGQFAHCQCLEGNQVACVPAFHHKC